MATFTEQELDRLEKAYESADEKNKLRPAVRKNGRAYLLMSEGERSYKALADKFNITTNRAGVYVNEYLTAIGRKDEAPRRGRRSNGTTTITTGNGMLDQVIALREQYLHEQDRVTTDVENARQAVEEFDADTHKSDVATEIREKITELQNRLKAWEADTDKVATKSAEDTLKDLTARRDSLDEQSTEQMEFLAKQVETANATLRMIVNMDENALKAITEQNAELGAEIKAEVEANA